MPRPGVVSVNGSEPGQIMPPLAYLAVACLDEVSSQELGKRRTMLLRTIASAGPGEVPGVLACALALVAVIAEHDKRASGYAADPDSPRLCKCGLRCRGLAAIDDHLDQFSLNDEDHYEATEADAARPPHRM
jgi:hypothetical protein